LTFAIRLSFCLKVKRRLASLIFLNENPRETDARDDLESPQVVRFIVILLLDLAFDAQMLARTTQEAGMSPASIALPVAYLLYFLLISRPPSPHNTQNI